MKSIRWGRVLPVPQRETADGRRTQPTTYPSATRSARPSARGTRCTTMTPPKDIPTVSLDDFIRRFSVRASSLMWFLGAGASASAGLPTAFDLIWRFKRDLYVSRSHGISEMDVDLSLAATRHRIDAHLASVEGLPLPGDKDEYAALFEEAYPSEADRQSVMGSHLSGGKPSYGHIALAALMRAELARIVWTTNFDTMVADACAKVFEGTSALTTASLDAPDVASRAFERERWPLEVKLHGDFRSRRLKNTGEELRHQDTQLRDVLQSSCGRYGLIVVGYSGRDDSIIRTLAQAMDLPKPFPTGLFWLRRDGEPVFDAVADLLRKGIDVGVEAAFVTVHSFDETLRDIARFAKIDREVLATHSPRRERWTPPPLASSPTRNGWPVVRFNALPIISTPTTCRLIGCEIGGTKEVRDAVADAGVDVVAVRSHAGVLAFGSDADVQRVFEPFSITEFDLHTLQPWRSAERGLLNEAIRRAVARTCGLAPSPSDDRGFFPKDPDESMWVELRDIVGALEGRVEKLVDLRWHEGVRLSFDLADRKQWLLFEPCVLFEGVTEGNKAHCVDFARERTVRRYNRQLDHLVALWAKHLARDGEELRAIGTSSGVDAVFRLSEITAFSRRSA